MRQKPAYGYFKRSEERNSRPWMILRESQTNCFDIERWSEDHWENAIDYWWQTRQEYDYWDINEREAMSEIPKLSERQREARLAKEIEEAATREKILQEQRAERERCNELDDWTQLEHAAIALHELYSTLRTAGFSEDQALRLVSRAMTGSEDQNA